MPLLVLSQSNLSNCFGMLLKEENSRNEDEIFISIFNCHDTCILPQGCQ